MRASAACISTEFALRANPEDTEAELAKGATVAARTSFVAKGATAEARAAGCTAVARVVWSVEMLEWMESREAFTSLLFAFGAKPLAKAVVEAKGATVLARSEVET